MIDYARLWAQLEKQGISQYRLGRLGISHSTLTSLKHNKAVSTDTIDKLCSILHCNVEDIMEYKESK